MIETALRWCLQVLLEWHERISSLSIYKAYLAMRLATGTSYISIATTSVPFSRSGDGHCSYVLHIRLLSREVWLASAVEGPASMIKLMARSVGLRLSPLITWTQASGELHLPAASGVGPFEDRLYHNTPRLEVKVPLRLWQPLSCEKGRPDENTIVRARHSLDPGHRAFCR